MTLPYYTDEHVTLYHGNCLEVDAWLAADVLVTDPPYGIGWEQGTYSGPKTATDQWHKIAAQDGIKHDTDTGARDAVLSRWGTGRPSVVFGSFKASAPSAVVQTLVWKKPIQAGVVGATTGYRTDVELVFLLGPHIKRPAARSSVLESQSLMGRQLYGHPHSKPVGVLEHLIEWMPTGIVADPFAGSGSTLIAARNLGRKAVGVEIEERYCELIARRLDQQCFDFGEGA